ncbi:MAG: leucine--tRNA ligase [Candidatus Auribacter fodinae]|uniref:Leucine--tRNA ligase n=1 Tax=Candidatus Auribacter fodinae TaxID=2093366 RepID=A0A3A4QYB4_9BACT|nr:MAG: leucine--tRNA ligase [Candidatus Auribacter fodinae]
MSTAYYEPSKIEPKWQKYWDDNKLFSVSNDTDQEKYYILCMFPYPSGVLHMGHVINYTIGDVLVRFYKMQGKSVLSPIGWDSFGLPAENAAIREGIHPEITIKRNINRMREQMKSAGWGYDWSREIATSHPDYYKFTQWLFLEFFKRGLAVKKKAPVNWCPNDQTVLANEQVVDGCCERCGTEVIQKDLEQWFFAMSQYAQKLLDNHSKLTEWPENVLKMQQEWIGRSEGARIDFKIMETGETLPVFTTRPDTIFGVTFMSIAPEHPMIEKLLKGTPQEEEVMRAVIRMRARGTSVKEQLGMEKEGVPTGFHVTNPVNGDKVPLWVANFALMTYGTGAVMSVPAHDQRDFEFAQKYSIPVKVVIQPEDTVLDPSVMKQAYVADGLMVNSGPFNGKHNRKSMPDLIQWIEDNGFGAKTVNYSLRDWLLSRQRYWGVPIPVIHCSSCGTVPVAENELPVLLPKDIEFRPKGESPLKSCESYMNTACPKCGKPALRDADTMDTFVDSSWYMFRYVSPRDEKQVFDKKDVNKWCPVDFYIGGIEHATMHLIYSRFFSLVMNEIGLIDFEEPFKRLFCQGMVCKVAHYCNTCKWLSESDVENGHCKKCGSKVVSEVSKMSKTKLNTVSPDDIIKNFGADTMRLYILSDTPPDREQVWSDEGVHGAHRFLRRFWDMVISRKDEIQQEQNGNPSSDKAMRRIIHSTIEQVTRDYIQELQFNTALARIYELVNAVKASTDISASVLQEALETVVRLLYPITPHICEELWSALGHTGSVMSAQWPLADKSALVQDTYTIVVQINGKVRSKMEVPADTDTETLKQLAQSDDKIVSLIEGQTIVKVIAVPRKLVNIVVK